MKLQNVASKVKIYLKYFRIKKRENEMIVLNVIQKHCTRNEVKTQASKVLLAHFLLYKRNNFSIYYTYTHPHRIHILDPTAVIYI